MNYKSFITILLLSFLTVIPSLASDSSLAQIKKELRILSKILRTTFMEEGQREKGQILVPANIETLYLKNQGAVMNVKIGSGHFRSKHNFDFDFDFEELDIRLPPVPVAPVLPRTIIIREDYDPAEDEDGEEMQEIIEVAREMAEETAEQIQEAEMALVESRLNDPEVRVEIRKIRDEARKALREQRKALREQETYPPQEGEDHRNRKKKGTGTGQEDGSRDQKRSRKASKQNPRDAGNAAQELEGKHGNLRGRTAEGDL